MSPVFEPVELKQDPASEKPHERDGSQNDNAVAWSKEPCSRNEGFLQAERQYDEAQ